MGRDFGGELGGCVLQGRSARSGFGVRFHPAKSSVFEFSTCAGNSGMSQASRCPDLHVSSAEDTT